MKVLETNVYVGPNVYARFPVIRQILDLGILEEWPTSRLGQAFTDKVIEYLPGLEEHGCSYREKGGFIRRMIEDEGTWLGHVMEHVAIELQNMAGSKVTFGKTRSLGEKGHYNVVFQYLQRDVGLEASRLARTVILDLLPDEVKKELGEKVGDFTFEEARDSFIRFAQKFEFGPSTASLVDAAKERDIPWIRLNRYPVESSASSHGALWWSQRYQAFPHNHRSVATSARRGCIDCARPAGRPEEIPARPGRFLP